MKKQKIIACFCFVLLCSLTSCLAVQLPQNAGGSTEVLPHATTLPQQTEAATRGTHVFEDFPQYPYNWKKMNAVTLTWGEQTDLACEVKNGDATDLYVEIKVTVDTLYTDTMQIGDGEEAISAKLSATQSVLIKREIAQTQIRNGERALVFIGGLLDWIDPASGIPMQRLSVSDTVISIEDGKLVLTEELLAKNSGGYYLNGKISNLMKGNDYISEKHPETAFRFENGMKEENLEGFFALICLH